MIDEWFDRSYQEGRAELHAGVGRLIGWLVRAIPAPARRKGRPQPQQKENPSCDVSSWCRSR
jgi:hypothetical protein